MGSYKYNLILVIAAAIWGFALVGQQVGMEVMGPWSFNGLRCLLGGICLIPLVIFVERRKVKKNPDYDSKADTKATIVPSIWCSVSLCVCLISQQYGLLYTSVGKAAFITAFYIFLTPIIGLFLKKHVTSRTWIAVVIALLGLFLITMAGNLSGEASGVNLGDMLMLVTALSYAAYLHTIDKFIDRDMVKISCFQFIIIGVLTLAVALVLEPGDITWANCMFNIVPLLYTGLISTAVGYTCQMIGQTGTNPNTTSIILSSETLFSLFAGWLLLGEVLRPLEYLGCIVVVVAIALAVIPEKGSS